MLLANKASCLEASPYIVTDEQIFLTTHVNLVKNLYLSLLDCNSFSYDCRSLYSNDQGDIGVIKLVSLITDTVSK